MRIKSLEVRNVCQHRHLKKEFSPGVTVILGRNGVGKTTVLSCIEAAVTGDWSCFPGAKGENVAQLAGPKDPSWVAVDLEHAGRDLRVARWLRPDKAELYLDGRGPETGKARINEVVEEVLQVPLAIVSQYGFVKQRAIFDFLTARPADRAAAFQVLTGTAGAERIHDLLGKELQDVPLLQMTDERESLRATIAEVERRMATAAAGIAALPEVDEGAGEAHARLRAAYDARLVAIRSVRSSRAYARARRAAAAALAAEAAARGEASRAANEALAAASPAADEAARGLAAWAAYRRTERARADAAGAVARLEAARPAPAPPPAPGDPEAAAEFEATGRDLYAGLSADWSFLSSFSGDVACCPTCGTPTAALAGRLGEVRARYEPAAARYAALSAAHDRERARGEAARRAEAALAAWSRDHAAAVARLSGLEASPPPAAAEAELSAVVRARDLAAEAASSARALAESSRAAAKGAADDAEAWRVAALGHASPLAAPRPDRGMLRKLRTDAEAAAAVLAERRTLEGGLREMARQVEASRARMAEVDRSLAEAGARNAWRALVQEARPLAHRDGLPRMVALDFLSRAEAGVNEALAEFGARFRVAAADDLSFTATFTDGRVQGAQRLSPGEKVVLALAFRVVVNALFARELGVLALDEPTDGLDRENIEVVEKALARLKGVSEERGLQVFVVTHERRLTNARFCDDTLDLGGW